MRRKFPSERKYLEFVWHQYRLLSRLKGIFSVRIPPDSYEPPFIVFFTYSLLLSKTLHRLEHFLFHDKMRHLIREIPEDPVAGWKISSC